VKYGPRRAIEDGVVTPRIAQTQDEQAACFETLHSLRPHLTREAFLQRVRAQYADGYRLACIERGGRVVAVAGYRMGRNLAWGKFLYVDDLVTHPDHRSEGLGATLLSWLQQRAREHGCQQLHLDSGQQRLDAHRFYKREGLAITGHHFAIVLDTG